MLLFGTILVVAWLGAVGAWWMWTSARRSADSGRLRSRLTGAGKSNGSKKKDENAPALIAVAGNSHLLLHNIAQRLRWNERLTDLFEQAGLKWSAPRFLHGCMAAFLVAFGACWLLLPARFQPAAYLAGPAAALLPLVFVRFKRASRMKRFEALFPESLEFISRSMRAGHAFSVSLEMIHKEFQEPLAGEFRRTFEESNLGMPLEMALERLARRVPSLDVHFFVSAVLLQKRTGGNLAEILDKLAYIMRERFKLRGRIRAISAHGRMTGIALTCIPLAVGALMFVVNPEYARFFFYDDTGNLMLAGAVLLQVMGYLIISKIVKIEV